MPVTYLFLRNYYFFIFYYIWGFIFRRYFFIFYVIICLKTYRVNLPIQPKNFKYKKKQKKRSFLQFNNNYELKFGDCGLLITRPFILTGPQLVKLKLFLKKASRRVDKTKRKLWFNLFPHLPLSKKPANVRMGKGKGKLKTWFINLRGGMILVEYKNLRYGRIKYFFKQTSFKTCVSLTKLFAYRIFFKFPLRSNNNFFFQSFWY